MKKVLTAWLLWIAGILVVLGSDYYMRLRDGYIHSGALDDRFIQSLFILIGSAAAVLLYRAAARYPVYLRIMIVAVQLAAGYLVLTVISVAYLCIAGINCLFGGF